MSNEDQNDQLHSTHSANGINQRKRFYSFIFYLFFISIFSVFENRFLLISVSLHVSYCTIAKNWGLSLKIFRTEGAEIFDMDRKKFIPPRLQITRGRRLCHFVDAGLIEMLRLLREEGISISVQFSFKYCRQNNINCTPQSSHSEKHQQRARTIAGLPPKVHSYLADIVLHSVRPSVCPVYT